MTTRKLLHNGVMILLSCKIFPVGKFSGHRRCTAISTFWLKIYEGLKARGINRLYSHQAEAITQIEQGHNVVIVTLPLR